MKNIGFIGILTSVCLICASCSSSSKSKLTNRELFEQCKSVNIEAFTKIAVATHQMDEKTAMMYADSVLYYLYRLDSNFVMMNERDCEAFMQKNSKIALQYCDSIFKRSDLGVN